MNRAYHGDKANSMRESGAALLSVVLVLGLLSVLIITITLYVNSRSTIVSLTREDFHKRVLVESAVAYGAGRVLSSPPGVPVIGDDRIRLNIGRASLSWVGESGRLDINLATPDRLIALFVGAGVVRDSASVLVDQIVMRRSLLPDSPLPNAFKALSGKRVGPFDHVIELLTIPGMTADLYARIEPLITVYGLANKIDPRLARTALISSLLPLSSIDLARIEAARHATDEEMNAVITSIPDASSLFDLQRSRATRIEITLQTVHGSQQRVEIVFVAFDDDTVPFRILEWHDN